MKLVFLYDYMNRRIRRQAYTYDGTAEAWRTAAESDVRFIYDGWNVVLELDALDDDAVIRKYTWGLDLSGTRQGAGGIGGLLAVEDANGTPSNPDDDLKYLYFHDANGNVGQLIDWRPIEDWEALELSSANDWHDSRLAAKYEYDPYGNTLVSEGPYAEANPFRFSTKYFDADTGLYYYGHRYYWPDIGRWMSRDPIEERGDQNVLRFASNSPTWRIDSLGLKCTAGSKCYQVEIAGMAGYNLSPDGAKVLAVVAGLTEGYTFYIGLPNILSNPQPAPFDLTAALGSLWGNTLAANRISIWNKITCKECKCGFWNRLFTAIGTASPNPQWEIENKPAWSRCMEALEYPPGEPGQAEKGWRDQDVKKLMEKCAKVAGAQAGAACGGGSTPCP